MPVAGKVSRSDGAWHRIGAVRAGASRVASNRQHYPKETPMNIALRCRYCALPLAAALILSVDARGEDASFGKKTYVYKTVGEAKIEADVYRAADATVRPVLVWLHGGALIVGS